MDALVQLQWPALTYNDKSHFANYDISVNNQSWLLSTNVLNVTVPYNVNTTIRISAVDCQAFTILETFELGSVLQHSLIKINHHCSLFLILQLIASILPLQMEL